MVMPTRIESNIQLLVEGNASSAFQSIQSVVKNVGLSPPDCVQKFKEEPPLVIHELLFPWQVNQSLRVAYYSVLNIWAQISQRAQVNLT